jgi:hypothetical protein
LIRTSLIRAFTQFRLLSIILLLLPVIILLLAFLSFSPAIASDPDKELSDILSSAESLFKTMRARDYPGIWDVMTSASQRTILDEAGKAIARSGGKEIPVDELRKDFEDGGPIARGYWSGFLAQFNPDIALEQSRWERGKIAGDRAEILITYKTAEKPALLKLFRENGRWKAGLVETFWGRK